MSQGGGMLVVATGMQAEALSLEHHKLLTVIESERFYSSIVQITVDGNTQNVVVSFGSPPADPAWNNT